MSPYSAVQILGAALLAAWLFGGTILGLGDPSSDVRPGPRAEDTTVVAIDAITGLQFDPARSRVAFAGARTADGEKIYQERCATCHQSDGQGVAGVFPPLNGSTWVTGNKGRLIRIVLHGMQGEVDVKDKVYNNRMPGWGTILNDKEVAQVATYIRTSWGNHASEVSTNEVQRVRAATRERSEPWTAPALKSPDHTGIPDVATEADASTNQEGSSSGHPYPIELPEVYRTFMPQSSPASIAVGLPDGQSYCFDAGVSYVRYAWQGGYIDNTKQWDGNGNAFTEIVGEVYYRNQVGFPLRFGKAKAAPEVEFKGYRIVDGGYPEFHYTANGIKVRELVKPHPETSGLVRTFEVGPVEEPLWFATGGEDAGVTFEASAGTWKGNLLRLSPSEAREFTITMARHSSPAP